MQSRTKPTLLLGLLGAATSASAQCVIPDAPPPQTIPELFSIFVQNPEAPIIHNQVMTFNANGDDEHLNVYPAGRPTFDSMWLDNGILRTRNIRAVIDLEYNDQDDTTKMFMTERTGHATAIFESVWACNTDTDELQVELNLISRQLDPPVIGGMIGVREVVGNYEFRYSPPGNALLTDSFIPVNMVIYRGEGPVVTVTTTPDPTTPVDTPTPTPDTTTTSTTSTTTPIDPPSGTPGPVGDYDFVSCWAEPDGGRALTSSLISSDDMTNEACAEFCSSFPYFGTQWNRECFCGSTLTAGSAAAPLSECDHPCTGDAGQMCGGSRRLSLYNNPNSVGPSQPGTAGDYALFGCVTDNVGGRTLTGAATASDAMTNEMCAEFCSGFEFFGTEWSVECFCGDEFAEGAVETDAGECSMVCGGDGDQLCGDGDRLSVYQVQEAA